MLAKTRHRRRRKAQPPPEGVDLLTPEQAAYVLQVSVESVLGMCAAGRLPRVPLPIRRLRFSRKQLELWVGRGCPRVPRK